jgi:enoyl-CoA hydratase/carnithine racemase
LDHDPVFDRDWSHLKVERDGHIVTVTLDRPEARNAMNPTMMTELTEVARKLRLRADVRAVILTSSSDYFSAGADLKMSREWSDTPPTLLEVREQISRGPDLCKAWEEIEAVTIIAVEGFCIGGGCALAVACDFRIMGEGAYMRLPEIPLGMNMSWRSIPRIAALVGPSRAKAFVMFGEPADA